MKYLITADLHGSLSAGKTLLKAWEREQADSLLLLGDVLGGATSMDDLQQLAQLLNNISAHIRAVRGNCDTDGAMQWLRFPLVDEKLLLREQGRLIFATHGHLWDEGYPPVILGKGDILLTGHTHVPRCVVHENFTYINPGSLARPRGGSARCYLLYDNGVFSWRGEAGQELSAFDWLGTRA